MPKKLVVKVHVIVVSNLCEVLLVIAIQSSCCEIFKDIYILQVSKLSATQQLSANMSDRIELL